MSNHLPKHLYDEVIKRLSHGQTLQRIRRETNVAKQTVRAIAFDNGYSFRGVTPGYKCTAPEELQLPKTIIAPINKGNYKGYSQFTKQIVLEMYASGLSAREISNRKGMSSRTILDWVYKAGITIRRTKPPVAKKGRKHKSKNPRRVKQRLLPNKTTILQLIENTPLPQPLVITPLRKTEFTFKDVLVYLTSNPQEPLQQIITRYSMPELPTWIKQNRQLLKEWLQLSAFDRDHAISVYLDSLGRAGRWK